MLITIWFHCSTRSGELLESELLRQAERQLVCRYIVSACENMLKHSWHQVKNTGRVMVKMTFRNISLSTLSSCSSFGTWPLPSGISISFFRAGMRWAHTGTISNFFLVRQGTPLLPPRNIDGVSLGSPMLMLRLNTLTKRYGMAARTACRAWFCVFGSGIVVGPIGH